MSPERQYIVSEKDSNINPVLDDIIVNDSCDSDVIVISD